APIDNLFRRANMSEPQQRRQLDLLNRLNRQHQQQREADAELGARIESFELAYRMQMSAPEALDVDREPVSVRALYGLDDQRCRRFGRRCWIARRLVERAVRLVQTYRGGEKNERSWDGHPNIAANHRQFAGETDLPIAGLLTDLKS